MRCQWLLYRGLVVAATTTMLRQVAEALPVGMFDCLQSIKSHTNSSLTTPSSPDYDLQRLGYDRNFDYKPVAIYYPATNQDAAAAIRCAATFNISVAPRSGGHSFEGYSLGGKDGALIIDLARFQQFSLDPTTGIATIGAGTRLGPMYARLWRAGEYLVPGGTCATVGIGGLALGGGVGMAARKYGTTSQSVVGMTMVDAEGTVRHISATSDPDLFWALRGAGAGSFGMITEFQIQAHKAPPKVAVVVLTYPWEKYREAIQAYASWGQTVTNDLYAGLVLYQTNVTLFASFFGDGTKALEAMSPFLEAVGEPGSKMVLEHTWIGIVGITARGSNLDQPNLNEHRYHRGRSLVYRKPMSEQEMDVVYQYLYDNPPPEGSIDTYMIFELWGGKINEPDEPRSVFDHHRGVVHSMQFGVTWEDVNDAPGTECAACLEWSDRFGRDMRHAYSSGPSVEAYQNYMERDLPDGLHAYYGDHLSRLMAIKQRVDPKNVFRFPQSIPLPSSSTEHSLTKWIVSSERDVVFQGQK